VHQFDWPALAEYPRWAPKGDALQYVLTKNGVSNLWEQKLGGGPPKQMTNFQSGRIFDFAWSHNGKQMALTRRQREQRRHHDQQLPVTLN
jgi:Tol biopolymer transport system component